MTRNEYISNLENYSDMKMQIFKMIVTGKKDVGYEYIEMFNQQEPNATYNLLHEMRDKCPIANIYCMRYGDKKQMHAYKDNKVLLDYITTLKKSFDDQDLGDFTSIYRVEE